MKPLLVIILAALCISTGFSRTAEKRTNKRHNCTAEFSHKASISEIRKCLQNKEFRWAIICEYNGWLSSHYPATSFGGSSGMVKINGENCTPHGSGTARATFIGSDRKEYQFAHARHRSCENASQLFHNAQYFLFFTPEGAAYLKRYAIEIRLLEKYNQNRPEKPQHKDDDFMIFTP